MCSIHYQPRERKSQYLGFKVDQQTKSLIIIIFLKVYY